jgi:hypothetical protein
VEEVLEKQTTAKGSNYNKQPNPKPQNFAVIPLTITTRA